jgi:hypothetical protein
MSKIPLDWQRLLARLKTLRQTSTSRFEAADRMSFNQVISRHLPEPSRVEEIIHDLVTERHIDDGNLANYRTWITRILDAEQLVQRNDWRKPRNQLRRMMKGKPPFR